MLSTPYYPPGLTVSGGDYIPNTLSVSTLIIFFSAGIAIITATSLHLIKHLNPTLRPIDRILALWFVLTGSIHCIFEHYFILNYASLASKNDLFAQLWKEYALSDSRYVTSEPFLLCIETFTVLIIGPLALLTAFLIACGSPHRHNLQALVATLHLYGNILYLSTSLLIKHMHGIFYCRPERLYFWVYFVGMNGVWIVVPAFCLMHTWQASRHAFELPKDGQNRSRISHHLNEHRKTSS